MQWTSVLYELSEKSGEEKIVVVIDVLDELNGNKNLGFLPEHLPENVFVIYSMRPIKIEKTHVGATAKLVKRKFKEAQGGVLFVDEAYSLCDSFEHGFGDERLLPCV